MVNPAQISSDEQKIIRPSGHLALLERPQSPSCGPALPSQMTELSHVNNDQRTVMGRLGSHTRCWSLSGKAERRDRGWWISNPRSTAFQKARKIKKGAAALDFMAHRISRSPEQHRTFDGT